MGDNVTVRAETPALQTDTAEVHSSLLGQELTNLPVPLGGNYQQVHRMLPGFAPPANSHSIPSNPARSLEFSVNGTSDDQNNTRIDGVSTANIQLPHVASYIPTLESIREVNIVTGSFDAEQGLAGRCGDQCPDSQRIDDAALNTGSKPHQSYNEFGGS